MMKRKQQLIQRFGQLAEDTVQEACFAEFPASALDHIEDFCEWLESQLEEIRNAEATR
jgi:hypothetical protein